LRYIMLQDLVGYYFVVNYEAADHLPIGNYEL
jgi:hypothetical protein